MRPLTSTDLLELDRYAALRESYRDAVIARKRVRRLPVGDNVTLVFEDRETLRFQVQEMIWIERIANAEKIQGELDVYNELMPAERELSATLFIEITEAQEIRPELDRLVGIDEHVSLELGDDAERIPARFDAKQMEEDRISAVQYIRFPFEPAQVERLCDFAQAARVCVDHPNYTCRAEIPREVRESLIADLSGEPASLLETDQLAEGPTTRDEIVFETESVRVLKPARPRARGHVVVEPIAPVASLLEAEPEILLELLGAVKHVARETLREFGSCHVTTELGGTSERLRWHVLS